MGGGGTIRLSLQIACTHMQANTSVYSGWGVVSGTEYPEPLQGHHHRACPEVQGMAAWHHQTTSGGVVKEQGERHRQGCRIDASVNQTAL